MTVTGDTKSLELSDLLQSFESHQRSCTLVLTTESGKAHIYFREGKISALVTDGRAKLGDLIEAWRIVPPRHLEEARRKRRRSKRSLVELLVQAGAVTEEKLRAAAEAALVEDVSDLIATGTKSFEFSNEEAPPPVFDADEIALKLGIPVSATLLEAARRTDHWTMIRKSIPSDTATFIAREHVEIPPDLEDKALGEQLMLALDGTRNVAEVANLFPHARMQAHECMARFVRDRLVRAAASEDLLAVAQSLERDAPEHARRVVARGLEVEPQNTKLLALESRLAGRLDDPKAAAAALKLTAHVHLEAGDTARARQALDQARALDSSDAAIRERILAIDLDEGRFAEAVRDGMQLVALYRAPGLHAKAREVLERLIEADPVSLELRLELARTQVDSGDPEAAVEGLTRHGKKLVSREEYVDARKVYEEVLAIGPSHRAAKVALEMIDKQIFAQRRARLRGLRRIGWFLLAGLAVAALVALEVSARLDYVRTTRLVEREELIEQRRYADAIHSFQEMARRHPFTPTVLFDVANRIDDLRAKLPKSSDGAGK